MTKGPGVGTRHLSAITLVAWLALSLLSCGVKSPPMAPQAKPLPVVVDLTATLADDAIVLLWSDPKSEKDIAGFDIYTSRVELTQAPCEGCPETFEKSGVLSLEGQADPGQRLQYRLSITPGFRYRIRVRPFLVTGAKGPNSNTVTIDVPP